MKAYQKTDLTKKVQAHLLQDKKFYEKLKEKAIEEQNFELAAALRDAERACPP